MYLPVLITGSRRQALNSTPGTDSWCKGACTHTRTHTQAERNQNGPAASAPRIIRTRTAIITSTTTTSLLLVWLHRQRWASRGFLSLSPFLNIYLLNCQSLSGWGGGTCSRLPRERGHRCRIPSHSPRSRPQQKPTARPVLAGLSHPGTSPLFPGVASKRPHPQERSSLLLPTRREVRGAGSDPGGSRGLMAMLPPSESGPRSPHGTFPPKTLRASMCTSMNRGY